MNPHNYLFISLILLLTACANSQQNTEPQLVGTCEGCEAILEYNPSTLSAVDTLPDFNKEGTQIKVSGTVFQADGQTPAEDVILYAYHTNQAGIYEAPENAEGWEREHGYIRGWMQTGADGRYTFYTLKPGAYPSGTNPAHIHLIVLEPDGKYYWIDGYHFKGDPLLSANETNSKQPRGGSAGLLDLKAENGILAGSRDIILGKNVPGYE